MGEDRDSSDEGSESHWWIFIAIHPAFLLFAITYTIISRFFFWGSPWIFIGILIPIASILFPIALYFDTKYVENTTNRWEPNVGLWMGLAGVGVIVPFIQDILAIIYIYKRHKYLGTP